MVSGILTDFSISAIFPPRCMCSNITRHCFSGRDLLRYEKYFANKMHLNESKEHDTWGFIAFRQLQTAKGILDTSLPFI